jgi:hypothetical protein
MKFLKTIILFATPLSLPVLLSSNLQADIFHMKDGTDINGTIISETSDSYLLRAEVTNNVFAEKTILKSKLSEITKVDPSIEAYKKLSSILPTPDLMTKEEYDDLIETKINPFLEKYPDSPHTKDAQVILETIKNEQHTIQSGGIKLNGKLLSPEEMEADKYDIQASVLEHKFMKYSQQKDYRAALSTLERLEHGYIDSRQCRTAQKAALIILPIYHEKLQKLLVEVDHLNEKRQRALDSMTSEDNARTKKIFAYEERQYQHMLHLANFDNIKAKWLPINQYYKEPIENNIKMVDIETKRINVESQKPSIDNGRYYRETYSALEIGDYIAAKDSFEIFKKGKPLQEFINELEPRLKDAKIVMDQLAEQKREEEALAQKLAAEEKARLAEEKRKAEKNAEKNEKGGDKGVVNKIKGKNDDINKLSN